MRWYTAIGMKKDDADGRFCVWVDGEEKVLTEMETILWAALTWSFCEEDKVWCGIKKVDSLFSRIS